MKSRGKGNAYLLSRAVEEPLEATFELGENIRNITRRSKRPVVLGILGYILLLLLLISGIYHMLLFLQDIVGGNEKLTTWLLAEILIQGLFIIMIFAVMITAVIYLIQIRKFSRVLLHRYSIVNGLKGANILKENKPEREGRKEGEPRRGKHVKNPIFAMLDLVEESMHELPQMVKLLRFSIYFIAINVVFISLAGMVKLLLDFNLGFDKGVWELGTGIAAVVIFLPTLKLLLDSEQSFRFLQTRHSIIDSVRFEESIAVPEGEDQLDRLIVFLRENDPYIKSCALAHRKEFLRDISITGQSGKEHRFDAYFSGMNILKDQSVGLGMPMGRFAVFIRMFHEEITLGKLRELSDAVIDVCKKENTFPLRVVALQWKVAELQEDVYNYVLEDPIIWKRTLTHVQIAAEEGEVYSFIPLMSYGRPVS